MIPMQRRPDQDDGGPRGRVIKKKRRSLHNCAPPITFFVSILSPRTPSFAPLSNRGSKTSVHLPPPPLPFCPTCLSILLRRTNRSLDRSSTEKALDLRSISHPHNAPHGSVDVKRIRWASPPGKVAGQLTPVVVVVHVAVPTSL